MKYVILFKEDNEVYRSNVFMFVYTLKQAMRLCGKYENHSFTKV